LQYAIIRVAGEGTEESVDGMTTEDEADDEIVDAVLTGSRAMIAVAVRSLSAVAEEITIAQYRTLVVLASRGPQKLADLAEQLAVTPPTAGRMCDRLVRRGLVARHRAQADRRVVRISLTAAGREIVDHATRQRRVYLAGILAALPAAQRIEVAAAMRAFAAAAGEVPDEEWPQGPVAAAGRV
jgi:DNA-binding MarR family transcriptional regulator